jgi:hypothetical protein
MFLIGPGWWEQPGAGHIPEHSDGLISVNRGKVSRPNYTDAVGSDSYWFSKAIEGIIGSNKG